MWQPMTMGRVGAMPAQSQPQSYAQVQAQYHQMVAEVGGPLSPMLLSLRWCRAMAPCDKNFASWRDVHFVKDVHSMQGGCPPACCITPCSCVFAGISRGRRRAPDCRRDWHARRGSSAARRRTRSAGSEPPWCAGCQDLRSLWAVRSLLFKTRVQTLCPVAARAHAAHEPSCILGGPHDHRPLQSRPSAVIQCNIVRNAQAYAT